MLARWGVRVDTRLGHTINEIFLAIPADDARELFRRVEAEAEAAELLYDDDEGTSRVVPILIRPRIIRPEQEAYFHKVCLDLNRALERLTQLYVEDDRVRALLPFTEREDSWLRDVWTRVAKQPQTVVSRLDANVDFADDEWDGKFHFFETNTVGIGGMYYAPTVDDILMRVVVPAMKKVAPAFVVKPSDDMRALLLEQLTIHARAIRRRRMNTALVQERELIGGPNEFPHLVKYLDANGLVTVMCDPRDLLVRGNELMVGDLPIDIVYRDGEIASLVDLEDAGADLSGMKHAFLNNQVVSSIAGELDHKSTFEVLTTPELAARFTQRQQRIFRHHVLWTRIVRETNTTDPDGAPIDLIPWLRRNKDKLVLKPNRSYGGIGIVVGPHVDLAQWDDALKGALAAEAAITGGVVAQSYVDVRVKDFPMLGDDGAITLEELYVVCGFLATPSGVGILGRASKKRVVNVTQKGGLTGILVLT